MLTFMISIDIRIYLTRPSSISRLFKCTCELRDDIEIFMKHIKVKDRKRATVKTKGNRKIQGVPQLQTAANTRHQEEEKNDIN